MKTDRLAPASATAVERPVASEAPYIKGEDELLRTSSEGRFDGFEAFRFRLISASAMQAPAFEHLLAADAARGVVPLEHQEQAARQILGRMRGRGMLCDEVGLGKTIEAGIAALELTLRGLVRRILVLAPPSLVAQWKEEMAGKFGLTFVSHEDPEFEGWGAHDRIVASIHTAKREVHAKRIAECPFDLVIVDEAHHLKNARTHAYRFVKGLAPRYFFLLTATPVENSLDDLFNLVSLVRPGQLATPREFRRTYVQRGEPLLPCRVEDLRRTLREVMVRNRRATSGVRFTRRYATTVRVEMGEAERRLYQGASALVRSLYAADQPASRMLLRTLQAELGSSPAAALPTLARLGPPAEALIRDLSPSPPSRKMEKLVEVVRGFDDRMLVFTRFQATHREVRSRLEAAGIPCASLSGEMRFRERQENLARFATSARVLVSTDVGSEGRNLQFCNAIVNFDLPWNPMRIEQRVGRISRIGQEREVYVFNLVATGTLEDGLLDLLDAKINMFQLVIGEIDSIIGHLDEERSFEEMIMDLWSRGDEAYSRSLGDLARGLLEAKARYARTREVEDRIFGEGLGTGGGHEAR